jgi:predicted extracellular nuclease
MKKSSMGMLFAGVVMVGGCGDDSASDDTTTSTSGGTTGGNEDGSVTLTTMTPTSNGTTTPDSATAGDTTGGDTDGDTTATTDPTSTGDPDTGGSSDSTTGSAIETTIYEIQQGNVAVDTTVEISSVTVTAVAVNGLWVQESDGGQYSGVFVYNPGDATVQLGDVVDVSGRVVEFFDLTQVDVVSGTGAVTVLRPGVVPDPEVLTITDIDADPESWESVFVRIENDVFTVTAINELEAVNEFTVSNDNGELIEIDDFIYDVIDAGDLAGFDVGSSFTAIQGPLNYSFELFKIVPRSVDDLEGFSG